MPTQTKNPKRKPIGGHVTAKEDRRANQGQIRNGQKRRAGGGGEKRARKSGQKKKTEKKLKKKDNKNIQAPGYTNQTDYRTDRNRENKE